MGGGAVIAMAAAARRRKMTAVLDAFRLAGATSADRAQPLDLLGLSDSRETEEFADSGVLVPGSRDGTWYLNEAAYIAQRDATSPRAVRVALIAVAVVLILLGALLLNFVVMQQ